MIEHYKKYEPLFGDWRISKQIGKGSFSEVYEIERNNFGTNYKAALKTITIPVDEGELSELMASGMSVAETKQYIQQSAKDIVDEFVLMSKLKGNSNIVSYEDHQVIEHEDKLGWDILMKMELLQPLNQYIKVKAFNKKDLIKLGIDICTALELCEKYNIIHRDIKPENIFISPNGDFKLGDFRIARSMEKATVGLSKKGTYSYMAPEVYKGEHYTSTVDIYSLGIVMYKLMNYNRIPFMPEYPKPIVCSDREQALMRRVNGEKIPLPAYMKKGRLVEIVLKACHYDPNERYQNATQMKEALKEILNTEEEGLLLTLPKDSTSNKAREKSENNQVISQEGLVQNNEEEEIEKTILLDREELTYSHSSKSVDNKGKIEKRIGIGLLFILISGVIIGASMLLAMRNTVLENVETDSAAGLKENEGAVEETEQINAKEPSGEIKGEGVNEEAKASSEQVVQGKSEQKLQQVSEQKAEQKPQQVSEPDTPPEIYLDFDE